MIVKELAKLIIALTKLADAKSTSLRIESELSKFHLRDYIEHPPDEDVNMDADGPWPDDFEEDSE